MMNQTLGSAPRDPPAQAIIGYRDIITHLDATPTDEIRLGHAEAIATQFGAHLTGVYTNMLPEAIAYSAEVGAEAIFEMEQRLRQRGATKAKMLAERLTRLGVPSELRKIEDLPHLLRAAVAREARWADLFVASCPRETDDRQWGSMIESVLFEGGHGVYLIPPGLRAREAMRTIVIGWADTREAARAVTEAMPLLRLATAVHLVGVKEYTNEAAALATLSDIAAHLARHGVTTSINVALASDKSVASVLLDQAHRVSADFIVTGAYGHSRVREWLLGGATRELLERSDIPLLMAH
jgi:nucleotide-binding universal stress UspA family protein